MVSPAIAGVIAISLTIQKTVSASSPVNRMTNCNRCRPSGEGNNAGSQEVLAVVAGPQAPEAIKIRIQRGRGISCIQCVPVAPVRVPYFDQRIANRLALCRSASRWISADIGGGIVSATAAPAKSGTVLVDFIVARARKPEQNDATFPPQFLSPEGPGPPCDGKRMGVIPAYTR